MARSGRARAGSAHFRPDDLHLGHLEDAQQPVGGHLDVLGVDLVADGFEDLCTVVLWGMGGEMITLLF